jgi:ribosome-associated toxin RatA of RatAB toxin-antitoxin module
MSHINRTAILPYADHLIFALVNDVAAYPDYMDGCVAAEIHEHSETYMCATLKLEKKGIRLMFTTENAIDSPKSIVMNLKEGPFDSFEGRWFVQRLNEDACKVILDLQFTLSSKLTSIAAKKLFDNVSNNMVDTMVKRAKKVYG